MIIRAAIIATLLPLIASAQKTHGDSLRSALLWRDSVSFFITPPPGWVLDSEVGKRDGPMAVLFRRGESWRSGLAVMYANMFALSRGSAAAVAAKVRAEVADWTQREPDAVVTSLPNIEVEGQPVLLRRFVSPSRNTYEAVAYYWQPYAAPILVLSARSDSEYQRAYPDFIRLVKSYGKGPRIKH